jgi:molecular chaperone GrpE
MNIDDNDQKENKDEEIIDNGSDNKPLEGAHEDGAVIIEEGTPNEPGAEDNDEPVAESTEPTYEELQSEVATIKDQLLRSLAEGENIRRRTEREKADMSKYAITNFAREIISVADNLTRALGSISDDTRTENEELANLCIGIEMTDKELTSTFEKFNIQLIDSIGQKFDHNIHQAMFEVDDPDQPAGMVVQEIQKGYVLHDRLLRPAMVGVSKGGPKLEITEEAPSIVEPAKEKVANDSSSAYEKQSDAVNQAAEGNNGQLDKEL